MHLSCQYLVKQKNDDEDEDQKEDSSKLDEEDDRSEANVYPTICNLGYLARSSQVV